MPEAAAGLDAPEADAGAAGEFDFRTAARFAGEGNGNGNGEWSPLHPRALPGAAGNGAPGGDARLKALKENHKQQHQQQQQQMQQQQMWKWPLYPGTPARNFAQPQSQPAAAMAEKRAAGVEAAAGGNVPQRFGAVKFNTAIAVKPPRSKWDDAEKWLVNTGAGPGESPAHPQQQHQQQQQHLLQQQHLIHQQQQQLLQQQQQQMMLQSKYLRARGGGSSSIAESSDGETGSSRTAEFVFPTAGAGAVPAATSPPPRHKQLLQQPPRRNAGTGMSGRFFSPEDVPKRSARAAAEQEAEVEAEAGGSAVLDAAEDGIGSSMGSEAFKDKFADPVVEQQPQSPQAQDGQIVVSHRDMGTQMTPIPSQRASRCATPGRANSPSRHNTPSRRSASLGSICLDLIELQTCHLAKLELRQLSEGVEGVGGAMLVNGPGADHGSSNWSTKEEEEAESSKRLRQIDLAEVRKSVIEARTAAWQEAEQAKYLARFKREEVKIQAWENHKRAEAEAEMKRIEVKLEKMRSHANEKAMNRLVSAHRKAEDMRAMAQAKRSEAAARTAAGAQQIRQSGRIPHRPSCFSSCAS